MNDYLDRIEKQLTELTEQGAHRRLRARGPSLRGAGVGARGPHPPGGRGPHQWRSEALAVLAAVAVAAAVVPIVVLNVGTGKPRRISAGAASSATKATATTVTTPATATTTPLSNSASPPSLTQLPTRFSPQSFTAISELTWWLLGSKPCPSGACPAVLQTTDGGPTFKAIQSPPGPLASSVTSNIGYSQIRFADTQNGYAYGPDLYATHNGGTTWTPVVVGGRVADLEVSAGEAYAIVTNGAGNSGQLIRSPVSQDKWAVVPAAGEVSGGLWVQGANVLLQSGTDGPGPNLLVSHDGGATFSASAAPSPGLPCEFEGAASPDVWAHCATGTESGVWLSHDGGAHFVSAEPAGARLMLPNSAVFGAASGTTAVVGYQQLYRTGDAGRTWTPVGPSGIAEWTYIGFSDSTHGVALGYAGHLAPGNEQLYYTTDAGQSYHLVPLP